MNKGAKIIRDPIHGDIKIKKKFVDVIDTPEFQRLRRINHLGTGNLLFPAAEYTRFSHSLGTFHVMKLIINHFEEVFAELDLEDELGQEEKNLALAAALLHDIGHGPLSHTFETLVRNIAGDKDYLEHEEWSKMIITAPESELRRVLEDNFGPDFPNKVAKIISTGYRLEKPELLSAGFKRVNILNLISSLISSQLDADRMDYLLRDSFFTGVEYGEFDLARLIESLRLTVKGANYYLCVPRKYLSSIEEYLLSRYHMYKDIYTHPFKREIETILVKLFSRAKKLYQKDKLNNCNLPQALISLFNQQQITIESYLNLDDIDILKLIKDWRQSTDPVLSELAAAFTERKKFQKLMEADREEIEKLKKELKQILSGSELESVEQGYFWLENQVEDSFYNELYQEEEGKIRILNKDGSLDDFRNVSEIISRSHKQPDNKKQVYVNFDLLAEEIADQRKVQQLKDKLKEEWIKK
ncbi:HD domain-containing protein [Halanaerobacter jeridensis]|uniref:HD superfamily phosphohydrolase n=1 Tax=Halanaerobacter jeridensis TaxID=706427 RepID=A0A938XQN7_9FIRM|nr:HD domain-containing protein [Halanaerobacter jeridensis]MBM7555580.1 HD superfamily phosphohydrolase [Halanaerobacter jeridensis]